MKYLKAKLAQKIEDTIDNEISTDKSNIIAESAKERINMLQSFVKEMMIPKADYGFIPNCDKPVLFKSGAEKLCVYLLKIYIKKVRLNLNFNLSTLLQIKYYLLSLHKTIDRL